jgi:two-component system cell cycle sensor histidine kinase/response regulator CckA
VVETEARFRHKDGSWRRLQVRATNRLDDPAVRGIVLSHREVPEHQQALRALRSSETRYHSLIQAMGEGVVVMEEPGTIRSANPAAERILGLTLDELQGRTSFDPRWRAIREDGSDFPGEEHPAIVALRTGVPSTEAIMGVHKPDGALTWISINARLLPDPSGSAPRAVVVTFADITARVQAKDQLEEALAQLRRLTDTVPGVVFEYLLAPDGTQRFPFISHRAAELVGVESAAIQRDARLAFRSVLPEDLSEMTARGRAAVEQRSSWSHEWRIRRDDGQIHWLSGHALPEPRADGSVVWTGFVIDVTHEKRLELRLSQAQRMESVGRLAGGVAHDFNNLLTVVSGNLELLAARAGWPSALEPYANAIRSAAERGTAFTRQLLTFTRDHATTPRLVDLNELVERMLPLLDRLVEERIEISASLAPSRGLGCAATRRSSSSSSSTWS